MNQFELRFFVIDDDGKEESVREGFFDTIEEVYHRIDNIGSRWFFYPCARICQGNNVIEEIF